MLNSTKGEMVLTLATQAAQLKALGVLPILQGLASGEMVTDNLAPVILSQLFQSRAVSRETHEVTKWGRAIVAAAALLAAIE